MILDRLRCLLGGHDWETVADIWPDEGVLYEGRQCHRCWKWVRTWAGAPTAHYGTPAE